MTVSRSDWEGGRVVMAGVSSINTFNWLEVVVANIWSDPRGFESHPSHTIIFWGSGY